MYSNNNISKWNAVQRTRLLSVKYYCAVHIWNRMPSPSIQCKMFALSECNMYNTFKTDIFLSLSLSLFLYQLKLTIVNPSHRPLAWKQIIGFSFSFTPPFTSYTSSVGNTEEEKRNTYSYYHFLVFDTMVPKIISIPVPPRSTSTRSTLYTDYCVQSYIYMHTA